MPILSYFLVVGGVLTGLLLWLGDGSQSNGTALTSSQTIGIPKFKPEPEPEHARATAVNFGAERERRQIKPGQTANIRLKQKTTANNSKTQTWNRFAEFPHNDLFIH